MRSEANLAVVEARARVRARVARAVGESHRLGARITALQVRRERLLERAAELCHASRVQRATRQRAHAGERGSPAVGQFLVEGLIDGEVVCGTWAGGRLVCDEPLRARALLLVDLEEEFVYSDPPRCFIASLEGPPIAVALTLIRACDRVTRIALAPEAA
jgi:hypothetical protein